MEETTSATVKVRDGLNYLVQQHREFEQLFERFEQAADHNTKDEIVAELVARVSRHASVEEQHVYPLFRDKLVNGDIIYKRNLTDDQMNKEILSLLQEMKSERDGELFDSTVRKFIMIEREHMEQEEKTFEALRSKLSIEELARLEEKIVASERTAPTQPHPSAPSKGFAARITHPIAGAMDKVKEKLTGRSGRSRLKSTQSHD